MKISTRITAAREAKGLSQSELARRLNLTPQAVQAWEAGNSSPRGAKRLQEVAAALGTTVEYLLGGASPVVDEQASGSDGPSHPDLMPVIVWGDDSPLDDEEVALPFIKEVELSAGCGRTSVEERSSRMLRFGKLSLKSQGIDPKNARCVSVSGNSMEPILRHGSTVAIDLGSTRIVDGEMYAINHAGQLRVKQVYRLPGGGIRLRSFNRDEHPDEEYSVDQMREQEIAVLGRVFWSGGFH